MGSTRRQAGRSLEAVVNAAVWTILVALSMAWAQEGAANLAFQRPVVSSGANWGSFKPGAITDGDGSTFTHPLAASGTQGFYYEVDLGASYHLDRVVIRNRGDGCCPERLSRYGVELRGDAGGEPGAVNWSAVVRSDGSNSGVGGVDTVTAGLDVSGRFEGRFLRVINTTGAGYSPQVAEIEVYGGAVPVIRWLAVDRDVLEPGQATRLRWSVVGAMQVSIRPGPGEGLSFEGEIEIRPEGTTEYRLIATNENGAATASVEVGVGVTLASPRIVELQANNTGSLEDEDGDRSDWIELWNPNRYSYSLEGHYLSDDPAQLAKWLIPAARLPPGGYLVVFASGKDRRNPLSELHTNFRLNADGDWVGLTDSTGLKVLDQVPSAESAERRFPVQLPGSSYGLGARGEFGFLRPPTPGTTNGDAFAGLVSPVEFSRHRGYYSTNFEVALTCPTPGAVVRYTVDRSEPTLTRGQNYSGPIPISRTTVLRAAAFREGWAPTPVLTHTYVFPKDVIGATSMRRAVTTNAVYGPQLEAGLKDLPAVVMVASSSISDTIEARVSFEWLDPSGGEGLHENCGAQLFGGAFTDFAKKSFRLSFRSEYGAAKLKGDLFGGASPGGAAAREFDQLELRSGSHDMAMRGFYLSNPFTDDTLAEMGHLSPHTRFVHLYLNGNYWGVYQLRERWGAAMHAQYLGGSRDQYESINGNWNVGGWAEPGVPYDGDGNLWSRIKTLRGSYAAVKPWVDVPQYVDMMLVWLFGGCEDEYRCVGPTVPGVGMKFLINDADGWFCVPDYCAAGDRTQRGAPGRQAGDGPGSLFSTLFKQGDPEYRTLLADRIQAALGRGGTLSPERNRQRLDRRLAEFQRPFLLESARWNYLTPEAWAARRDFVRSDWLPRRTSEAWGIFRSAGFVPRFSAPDLQAPTGVVAAGYRLQWGETGGGVVTYTEDGTDPRLPGGGVSPRAREYRPGGSTDTLIPLGARWRWYTDETGLGSSAIVEGHPQWSSRNWKHPDFGDSEWSVGAAQLGYGEGDEATVLPFGRDSANKWVSAYFRQTVEVRGVTNLVRSILRIRRDDGAIVYLNGRELARFSMPASEVGGQTLAVSPADDGQDLHEAEVPLDAIREGSNVVAVELHQSSRTSSDASFDLEWGITRGGPASGEEPVLERNTVIKARSRQGTEWSGLTTAFVQVGSTALPVGSLAVSEMDYHPTGDGGAEYLVLRNISHQAVNLRGARFTRGIEFAFDRETDVPLAPNDFFLLVRDLVRFRERHGGEVPVHGIYGGSLDNAGERLALTNAGGDEVFDFEFRTRSPWPEEADGGGARLLLAWPDLGLGSAQAWRAGESTNRLPGVSDATRFTGDPNLDQDGDGWGALLEYAFGSDATNADSTPGPWMAEVRAPGWLVVRFAMNGRAEDIRCEVQSSVDLVQWSPAIALGTRLLGLGLSEASWGVPLRLTGAGFLRVNVVRP
ncbi:MAG: lamin tail domain-containing protein [Verrucomicrobiales bacterium]|nr:lamin tail domain-containing protein [Verrucomicrobiales bacterium]